MLQKGDELVVQ